MAEKNFHIKNDIITFGVKPALPDKNSDLYKDKDFTVENREGVVKEENVERKTYMNQFRWDVIKLQ